MKLAKMKFLVIAENMGLCLYMWKTKFKFNLNYISNFKKYHVVYKKFTKKIDFLMLVHGETVLRYFQMYNLKLP